jgi:hypothetical protein
MFTASRCDISGIKATVMMTAVNRIKAPTTSQRRTPLNDPPLLSFFRELPHSSQKLNPARFLWPHFLHITSPETAAFLISASPHSSQNCTPERFACPHEGQITCSRFVCGEGFSLTTDLGSRRFWAEAGSG